MPFALLIIGIVLIVVAVRGTQETFVGLVRSDFSGPGNFFYWIVALVAVGAVGYIEKLKPISDGLLVIILAVLILSRGNPSFPGGGFFQQFMDALAGTNATADGAAVTVGLSGPNAGPNGRITLPGGVTLGSNGRITSPGEWRTQPNGDIWTPTGN